MTSPLTYDRIGSVRTVDGDGRLHVKRTPISKANICSYYGREIPAFEKLGLEPNRLYRMFREPNELARAAASFNGLQVLDTHAPVNADAPRRDRTVGALGNDAAFDAPYLTNSLTIWDSDAIARIRDGTQRELSCAYAYTPDMTPGHHDGEAYDGVMRALRGNHVALVDEGRAGPDVLVADAALSGERNRPSFSSYTSSYPPSSYLKGDALMIDRPERPLHTAALDLFRKKLIACGHTPLEADNLAALANEIFRPLDDDTSSERRTFKTERDDVAGGEKANRTLERERRAGTDPSGATDLDIDGPDALSDADPSRDADIERAVAKAVARALEDERERARATEEARRAVRPLVGDVYGMDSAPTIYRYALNQQGIACDGVNEAGLKALVRSQTLHGSTAYAQAASYAARPAEAKGYAAPRKL